MSQQLTVRITATDDASAVFASLGSNAEAAGQSIEQAGSGAETFGAAMEAAAGNAETAGASIESVAGSAESAGASIEAAGSGAESFGAAMESASGSAESAGSALEAAGSSAESAGSALESAGGSAESAGASIESIAGSAESVGGALESASASAESAGSALEGAGSSAEAAGSSIEGAASRAESAGSAFESAGSAAESAGSSLESTGSAAETAGSALESAGSSAESAGASLETVGSSASTAGAALESAGASAQSAGSSFDGLGSSLGSVRTGLLAAGVAATGVVASMVGVARSAWDQVDATQQATSAMRAYETQAGQVDEIQRRLLEFARSAESGGIFFTEELYAAAQGLVTYGAEMSRVTDYVEIMARAVGQGTATWVGLGEIIGRVGSQGRLTGQDFDLLTRSGYQLDDSLRNTSITWNELFAELERGIPADVLEGQVNTIRGALSWLEGSVRDVGAAFLQVDRDTGTFITGGLGDRLFQSLSTAREVMLSLVPAAEAAGNAITFLMDVGGSVASAFQSLPDPIQTSVLALASLGVGLTTAGAAIRVMVPAVTALGAAFRTLAFAGLAALPAQLAALATGFRTVGASMAALGAGGAIRGVATGLMGLLGRINPVGLALTGLVAIGAPVVKSFLDQRAAAEDYETSLDNLSDTMEMVRRAGDESLAGLADAYGKSLQGLPGQVAEIQQEMVSQLGDPTVWREVRVGELIAEGMSPPDAVKQAMDEWLALVPGVHIAQEEITAANNKMIEALNSPDINADAYIAWAMGLLKSAAEADDAATAIKAALDEINNTELSEFSIHVDTDDAEASLNDLAEALDGLDAQQRAFEWQLADLRLEGADDVARDLEMLDAQVVRTLGPDAVLSRGITIPPPDGIGILQETQHTVVELGDASELSAEQAEVFDAALADLFAGVADGSLDAQAVTSEFARLRAELYAGNISSLEYAQGVIGMRASIDEYAASSAEGAAATDAFAVAQDLLGAGMEGVSLSLEEQRQLQQDLTDARQEFLADGSNILSWWQEYESVLEQSGQASSTASEGFGELVSQVQELESAASGLDTMLYYFDQIEALGQRSSAAGAIADALFGPGGDPYDGIGPLRDIYDAGIIGQTQFNEAVTAGIEIQESNLRVQDSLNAVRADQLPLLAEQQSAYEAQIASLVEMTPLEQQRALALMDSAMQAQVAEQYATAYAASVGEIPEEVATELIANAAQADPVLRNLLEDMGLIEEGADGEIRVNFPDADSTISAIDRMTVAVLAMQAAASDQTILEVATELYGEEEARAFLGQFEEWDGREIGLTVATAGIDVASAALDAIEARDIEVPASADVSGAEQDIATLDGTEVEVTPVVTALDTAREAVIAGLQNLVGAEEVSIDVTADTSQAYADVGELLSFMNTLRDTNAGTIPITADAADAYATVGEVLEFMRSLDAIESTTLQISADATSAYETMGEALDFMRSMDVVEAATLQVSADATSAYETIGEALDFMRSLDVVDAATLTIDADASPAYETAGEALAFMQSFDGITYATLGIDGDATGAYETMGEALAMYTGTDGVTYSTLGIDGDGTGAYAEMGDVLAMYRGTDGVTYSTLSIDADGGPAYAEMGNVLNMMRGLDGTVQSTMYIDVVTRRRTVNLGGGSPNMQHGGVVPSYASGGVIAELAEAGPELVYYPDGDVGLASHRGLYDVAPGSYVSSAAATRSTLAGGGVTASIGAPDSLGGVTVNVNVSGDVYGVSDLTSKISDELVPVIAELFRERHAGQGV